MKYALNYVSMTGAVFSPYFLIEWRACCGYSGGTFIYNTVVHACMCIIYDDPRAQGHGQMATSPIQLMSFQQYYIMKDQIQYLATRLERVFDHIVVQILHILENIGLELSLLAPITVVSWYAYDNTVE